MVGEIAQAFLEVVCYFVARIFLPVITFGRVVIEPMRRGRKLKFRGHGTRRLPNGKIVLTDDLASLIGLLMITPLVALGLFVYFHLLR
jgi:hypothetical protein